MPRTGPHAVVHGGTEAPGSATVRLEVGPQRGWGGRCSFKLMCGPAAPGPRDNAGCARARACVRESACVRVRMRAHVRVRVYVCVRVGVSPCVSVRMCARARGESSVRE